MIFLTVGTQLPFNRLVRAADQWAAANPGHTLFGQTCQLGPDDYTPQHFEWAPHLSPADIDARFRDARLIVAHAGMGTLITALSLAIPILIMPRRAALGEQRNDHQLGTAARFGCKPGVTVAREEADVIRLMDAHHATNPGTRPAPIAAEAEPRLIAALRDTILAAPRRR